MRARAHLHRKALAWIALLLTLLLTACNSTYQGEASDAGAKTNAECNEPANGQLDLQWVGERLTSFSVIDDQGLDELLASSDLSDAKAMRAVAAALAAKVRGTRLLYWTDRVLFAQMQERTEQVYQFGLYVYSMIVVDRSYVALVESVYFPLLLDADPEVRHLGAHMLLMAYVRGNQPNLQTRIDRVIEFCSQDDSQVVRNLAKQDHPVFRLLLRPK